MRADIDTVVEGMASPDDGKWFTITSTANLSQEQKNAAIVQRLVAIQQYLGDRGVETTLIEEALALKGYGFNIKYTQGSYLPGKWEAEPVLYIGSGNPAKGGTNYSGVNFKEGLNYLEKHHTKPLPRGESPTPDMFEGIVEAVPDPSVGAKFIILSPVHLSLKQRQAAMVQGLERIQEYLQARGVQMEFDHTGQRLEAPGFILYYADSHTVGGGWRAEPMILDQKMVSGKMYYFGNADFVEGINLLVNTLAQKPLPRGESPTPDMFESANVWDVQEPPKDVVFILTAQDYPSYAEQEAAMVQGLERLQEYLKSRGVVTMLFPEFRTLKGKGKGFRLRYAQGSPQEHWRAVPVIDILTGPNAGTSYYDASFPIGLKHLEKYYAEPLPRSEAPTPDMFEEIVESFTPEQYDDLDKIGSILDGAKIDYSVEEDPPHTALIGNGIMDFKTAAGIRSGPAEFRIHISHLPASTGEPAVNPILVVTCGNSRWQWSKYWIHGSVGSFADGLEDLLTNFHSGLPRGEAPTADQFERALPPSLELLVNG